MAIISFFEKLCKLEHLETAWGLVKQKKSAGGIDEVSVADFAKNERQELLNLYESRHTFRANRSL